MKIVLQRVKKASVSVDDKVIGSINKGYLLLFGVGEQDDEQLVDKYIDKILKLRIFEDENGKTNLSIKDVNGEILIVSQFTLYANCKKGNRPSFTEAGSAKKAKELYEYAIEKIKEKYGKVQTGQFGAHMEVSLINDGPFTIVMDNLF